MAPIFSSGQEKTNVYKACAVSVHMVDGTWLIRGIHAMPFVLYPSLQFHQAYRLLRATNVPSAHEELHYSTHV